jgi:hypothetical protein
MKEEQRAQSDDQRRVVAQQRRVGRGGEAERGVPEAEIQREEDSRDDGERPDAPAELALRS